MVFFIGFSEFVYVFLVIFGQSVRVCVRACFHFVNFMVQTHVENLECQVMEQEAYHNELQEVERWLLQMSSRMVTPDPTVGGSLEVATQQLARHKVTNHIT